MSESFTLHFLYKGIPKEIACTLRASAYTYQFLCVVEDHEMILEKDDEGNLRAMEADPFSGRKPGPDPALIRVIMEELEKVLS